MHRMTCKELITATAAIIWFILLVSTMMDDIGGTKGWKPGLVVHPTIEAFGTTILSWKNHN